MDDAAQVKTLAHELGHVMLHRGPDNADAAMHRGIAEVEAESVALMVGAAHGLATDDYTIPYVASWASSVPGKTPVEVVQSTAERVRGAAVTILDKLDTPQVGDGNPPGLDREALAAGRGVSSGADRSRSGRWRRSGYEHDQRCRAVPTRRPRDRPGPRGDAAGRGRRRRDGLPDRHARPRALLRRRLPAHATTSNGCSTTSPPTWAHPCGSRSARPTTDLHRHRDARPPTTADASSPAQAGDHRGRRGGRRRVPARTRTWPSRSSSPTRSPAPTAPPDSGCHRRCSKPTRDSWCSWARSPAPSWSVGGARVNPRGQGVDDDLVNLGLGLIAAVGVLAAILRLAGIGRRLGLRHSASRPGAGRPGSAFSADPGDPATALGADGLAAWVYWLVLALHGRRRSSQRARCCGDASARSRTRPSHDPRRLAGVATGRDVRAVRLAEGTARSRPNAATLARQARAARRRLPARPLPRPGRVGVGRGLDPAARPAPLRQGPARRHQRDPRRTRRGHHHRHPTRQHRRHPHRPSGARPGRGLRPPAPRRGTPGRGCAGRPSAAARTRSPR